MYKSLYEYTLSFLLDVSLGAELLGHMEVVCLLLLETAEQFSKVLVLFLHCHQQCLSSSGPHPC